MTDGIEVPSTPVSHSMPEYLSFVVSAIFDTRSIDLLDTRGSSRALAFETSLVGFLPLHYAKQSHLLTLLNEGHHISNA